MRMALHRQVQRRVGGMEVPTPAPGTPTVAPTPSRTPSPTPSVPSLDPTARHALIADDLLKALLAHRPQRQMIIQQPPEKLPTLTVKTLLKLRVRQTGSVRPIEKAHQRLELVPATSKRSRPSRIARAAAAAAFPCRIFAASLPARQDFTARGVKFATTGVEIGGHAGHLRGRR